MSTPPANEHVGAIIVAAGESLRMRGVDKLFAPLLGKPLLLYPLQVFQTSCLIHDIVLVLNENNLSQGQALLDQHGWGKVHAVCPGGPRRQDSVRSGLESLPHTTWVVVHDGARPLPDEALLRQGLEAARDTGAAVPVVPPVDTIKELDGQGHVVRTLPRERLGLVQTPQVFRRDLLHEAHQRVIATVTDDAAMVEVLGYQVKTFPGSPANVKVTTPEDLSLVEALLTSRVTSAREPTRS